MKWFKLNICKNYLKRPSWISFQIIIRRFKIDDWRPTIFTSNGWLLMPWTDLLPGKGYSGSCPDVLVDCPGKRASLFRIGHTGRGLRCLRFRSDPERTCKWMCVRHWISCYVIKLIYINIYLWWRRIYSLA